MAGRSAFRSSPCPERRPKYPATFFYDDESDPGPYAIPLNAPIEGGSTATGDRHAIAIDADNCILYELYRAFPQSSSWTADSGAIFDLKSNALRPATWTSADAAGLPIMPGLVTYEEVLSGEIKHAIRFTAPQTRREYVWPARHYASSLTGTQYPRMGERFRLKAGFNISPFPADVQVILRAMKKYGIMLADNGSAWFISGKPDPRWNNDNLHTLRAAAGLEFRSGRRDGAQDRPEFRGRAVQSGVTVDGQPVVGLRTRGSRADVHGDSHGRAQHGHLEREWHSPAATASSARSTPAVSTSRRRAVPSPASRHRARRQHGVADIDGQFGGHDPSAAEHLVGQPVAGRRGQLHADRERGRIHRRVGRSRSTARLLATSFVSSTRLTGTGNAPAAKTVGAGRGADTPTAKCRIPCT